MLKKIVNRITSTIQPSVKSISWSEKKIDTYIKNGRIPWSEGYVEYKYKLIKEVLNSEQQLSFFRNKNLPADFAIGIDERIVEYPWIFSRLSVDKNTLLDAGSTFNFDFIVEHPTIKSKEMTIYTFYPEKYCFFKQRINYVFGDLRDMYFKNEVFDEIVCQSTIEHIDMDNSIYGYEKTHLKEGKSYEYLKVVQEIIRVLNPGGKLLLTFPFGKFENHGFFQQFDEEMLSRIINLLKNEGRLEIDYFKYEKNGWRFAKQEELYNTASFNPHTGDGKLDDGAAHSRSIACIQWIKESR